MKIEFEKAFEDETSRNENLPILNNHVFGDTVEELSNHTHSSNLLL